MRTKTRPLTTIDRKEIQVTDKKDGDLILPYYYEVQLEGWCGMHALNNYLGGTKVTERDCRRAYENLISRGTEDKVQHLKLQSGWMSIELINVLGAGRLGFQVEKSDTSLNDFILDGRAAALVNWNNQHWTVLSSEAFDGPWIHTNSVLEPNESMKSYYGRVETTDKSAVAQILDEIQEDYGAVSLHCITKSCCDGHKFAQSANRSARPTTEAEERGDEGEEEAEVQKDGGDMGTDVGPIAERMGDSETSEISIVSVNVSGLGQYLRTEAERIAYILKEVLLAKPDVLAMQEVTLPMYKEIKRILTGWQVRRRSQRSEEYFNVTATKSRRL